MVLNKKGFTLIEIVVSFAILAILVAIVTTTINPLAMINRGKDARRKSDLNRIKVAFEEYQNDKGFYPKNDMMLNLMKKENCGKNVFSPWLKSWPCDPNGNPYYIFYDDTNSWFKVLANLEDKQDKSIPKGWYIYESVYRVGNSDSGLGVNNVNYGVSSPNVSWFDVTIDPKCHYNPLNHDEDNCSTKIVTGCNIATSGCKGPDCYAQLTDGGGCDAKCKVNCCGGGCP